MPLLRQFRQECPLLFLHSQKTYIYPQPNPSPSRKYCHTFFKGASFFLYAVSSLLLVGSICIWCILMDLLHWWVASVMIFFCKFWCWMSIFDIELQILTFCIKFFDIQNPIRMFNKIKTSILIGLLISKCDVECKIHNVKIWLTKKLKSNVKIWLTTSKIEI